MSILKQPEHKADKMSEVCARDNGTMNNFTESSEKNPKVVEQDVDRSPIKKVSASFRNDDYFGKESSVFTLYDHSQGSSEQSDFRDDIDSIEDDEFGGHCAENGEAEIPLQDPVVTTLVDSNSIEKLKWLWAQGDSPSKKSLKSKSPCKKSKRGCINVKYQKKSASEKRVAVAKSLRSIKLNREGHSAINEVYTEDFTKNGHASDDINDVAVQLKNDVHAPESKKLLHPSVQIKIEQLTKPCEVRLQRLKLLDLKSQYMHVDMNLSVGYEKSKAKSQKFGNAIVDSNARNTFTGADKKYTNTVMRENAVSSGNSEQSETFSSALNGSMSARLENGCGIAGESNIVACSLSNLKESELQDTTIDFVDEFVEDLDFDSGDDYVNSDDDYSPYKKENLKTVFTRKKKGGKSTGLDKIGKKSSRTVLLKESTSEENGKKIKPKGKFIKIKGAGRTGCSPVSGKFECKLCDYTACEKNLLDKHRAAEHKLPWVNCKFCDQKFKSKEVLLEHEARTHTNSKPFKCLHEGCEYASNVRGDLQRHQSKHSEVKSYVCQICGWSTKWRRNLRGHHLMRHTEGRKFKCSLCPFTAKRNHDIKQHMFRHNDEKPIVCDICGFRVKTNWELRSHSLKHSSEKPFKCTFPGCQASTKTNADLTKHMRCHNTERNVVCPICSKAYKDQIALNKHKSYAHTNERLFRCDVCDKSFKCKAALKKHMNIHSGIRAFKCDVCDKRFSSKSNMQMHAVTHDVKVRPYICPLCPYAAKETHHLLAHIGTFHGDKYTYFCEFCNKPFRRFGQLQIHYSRMHKKEAENLMKSEHIDMSVLKKEIKLDLEKVSEERERELSESITDPNDDGSSVQIKEEPDNHLNEIHANGKESLESLPESNMKLLEEIHLNGKGSEKSRPESTNELSEEIGSAISDYSNKQGTKRTVTTGNDDVGFMELNEMAMEEFNTDVDSEHYDTEVEKLETEMETAGNVDLSEEEENNAVKDDSDNAGTAEASASFQEHASATVAIYNGLRLPLATKGFGFNYQKNGKKPKSWFMDTSCMDEQSAAKQKAYLRRIGVHPPLPRGKKKKGGLAGFLKERKRKRNANLKKSNFVKGIGLVAKASLSRTARFKGKYTEFESLEGDDLNLQEVIENFENKQSCTKSTKTTMETKKVKSKNVAATTAVQQKKNITSKQKANKLQTTQEKKKKKLEKFLLSSEKKHKQNSKKIKIRKPTYMKNDSDANQGGNNMKKMGENYAGKADLPGTLQVKKKKKSQNVPAKDVTKGKCTSSKSKLSRDTAKVAEKPKYNKKYVPVKKAKRKTTAADSEHSSGKKDTKNTKKSQTVEKLKSSKECAKASKSQKQSSKCKKIKVKISSSNTKQRKTFPNCIDNSNTKSDDGIYTNSQDPQNDFSNAEGSVFSEAEYSSQIEEIDGPEVKVEPLDTVFESSVAHPVFMIKVAGAEANINDTTSQVEEKEGDDVEESHEMQVNATDAVMEGDNDDLYDGYHVVKREPSIEADEM